MKPIDRPEPFSTWRHVKTGSTYTVIGVAQCSTNNQIVVEESVVYISHSYQEMRYRELKEFMDGRFVRLDKKV